MAQTAAHLVECVMPWVPTRQWVVSVPRPLRYWTASSRDLTVQVHGIIRTTTAQFYVNQAVKRGAKRHKVQPGSVTFLQRTSAQFTLTQRTRCASVNGFPLATASAIGPKGLSLHANTEIPAHRRDQLERLMRYSARGALSLERLEQDATGALLYRFNRPWSDGTTGIKLSPLELLEKLAAFGPLPRVHLVRYSGCLAPHSTLRAAIIPHHASEAWMAPKRGREPRIGTGLPTVCQPQSGDFLPHHGYFVSTGHPVRIIEGAITQHRHHDAQQSIRNGA